MRALPWLLSVLGAALLTSAAGWAAPGLALSPRLAFSIAFVFVAAELVLAARWAGVESRLVTGLGVGATLAALAVLRSQPITPVSSGVLAFVLLLGVTLLGAAIGGRIQQPGHLLAVFGISSLADLWSVYDPTGPSARLAEQATSHPEQLVVFALPWPMLGTERIEAIIGAGDILFAALYLAALSRHGLAVTRAAWAIFWGLITGLIALLALERSVALLPLIGAAVMLVEPEARSLSREDRRSVSLVLMALSVVIVYRLLR